MLDGLLLWLGEHPIMNIICIIGSTLATWVHWHEVYILGGFAIIRTLNGFNLILWSVFFTALTILLILELCDDLIMILKDWLLKNHT